MNPSVPLYLYPDNLTLRKPHARRLEVEQAVLVPMKSANNRNMFETKEDTCIFDFEKELVSILGIYT